VKKSAYIAVVLFLAVVALAAGRQQHAPMAAQCQADAAVWYRDSERRIEYMNAEAAHMKYGTPNQTEPNKLSFDEIQARIDEMNDCMGVDPKSLLKYSDTLNYYAGMERNRVFSFMKRHDLWSQFHSEDAQGKR
jgi:hypothetical protein